MGWEGRWEQVGDASLEWERQALAALRHALSPTPSLRVWALFELFGDEGAAFNADALVATRAGVFLLELVPEAGLLVPGPRAWQVIDEAGQVEVRDSPVVLARQKAAALQQALEAVVEAGVYHAPRIYPLVVLTASQVRVDTARVGASPEGVVRLRVEAGAADGVIGLAQALEAGVLPGGVTPTPLTPVALARLVELMDRANFGPARKHREVGPWLCGALLATGDTFQDFLAEHQASGATRRVRQLLVPRGSAPSQRERLRVSARREVEALAQLQHAGVLRAEELLETAEGPALVFEHPAGAQRLDHLLEAHPELTTRERMELARAIVEAVQYAHRKHIIHRALSPHSVLVVPPASDAEAWQVRVFNWQTSLDAARQTGTHHIQDYLEDATAVYLAPEIVSGTLDLPASDVWGLGVLLYALFAERAPAESADALYRTLATQRGLRLSAVLDGVPLALDALIFDATQARHRDRLASVEGFAARFQAVWREIVLEGQDARVDPLQAQPGEELDGRWRVVRRLGSGASATALLVTDAAAGGEEVVLKVAHTEQDARRLEDEARALDRMSAELLVVSSRGVVDVGDQRALIVQYAGETLRQRLDQSARLSLDDMRRFGEDLCALLCSLEEHSVLHRDIKPANLGIGTPSGSTQRLMLFDFSLAGSDPAALKIGTVAYRDPFLPERQRWDTHADVWSGAVTLYEMATGRLPRWEEELVLLHVSDAVQTPELRAELFPASVRDDMLDLFGRALHRDLSVRFGSAGELLRAWQRVFEETTHTTQDDVRASLERATLETPVSELELSAAAREALDRLNLLSVGALIDSQPQSIYFQRGASSAVRRELRDVRARLVARLGGEEEVQEDEGDWRHASLDRCANKIVGEFSEADIFMTLDARDDALPWPSHAQLAERAGLDRAAFLEQRLIALRHIARRPSLKPLAQDVVMIIERDGGVVRDDELARALLAWRGALSRDVSQREALAASLSRVMVELLQDQGKVELFRTAGHAFILTRPELKNVLVPLGQHADALALAPTLRSSMRVQEDLSRVFTDAGVVPLPPARLLTLAAHASQRAAVSARRELYPRGMEATRALRLASGALAGQRELGLDALIERVTSRYPEAAPLPADPLALDGLLQRAELSLRWDADREVFATPGARALDMSTTYTRGPTSWTSGHLGATPDDFERELDGLHQWRGFRIFMVEPKLLVQATARLTARFADLQPIALDALWIHHLDQLVAAHSRLTWANLYAADRPDASTQDRNGFAMMLRGVHRTIQHDLCAREDQALLLTDPGLLVRWHEQGALRVLDALARAAGGEGAPRLVWLMLPADHQSSTPTLNGQAIPYTSPSELVRVPRRWVLSASPPQNLTVLPPLSRRPGEG